MFRRGHPGTPIDPAPVLLSSKHCSTSHFEASVEIIDQLSFALSLSKLSFMLRPAVNRQPGFRRGLVEQSNAEKNNPVG